MEYKEESEVYITIKDHNENFGQKVINLSKSEIGKVSKRMPDNINQKVLRDHSNELVEKQYIRN